VTTEHERIARIKQLLSPTDGAAMAQIEVGIGDDCAVLSAAAGPRVWTIDSAVEGVHFRRDRMSLDAIGYRAFMAAASDIAAMGARATGALSALTLPATLGDAELDALVCGVARAATRCACPVVGGNLTRGGELSLTTTVIGEPYAEPLLRSGAKPGDGLFVTGPLGGAALGLQALVAEQSGLAFAPFVEAFLSPRARLDLALELSRVATAAIDLSDGLLQDAGHVCRASNVDAIIEVERVPRLPDFDALAATLGLDPATTLVAGGEDYEILFAAPLDAKVDTWATRIGHIQAGQRTVRLVDASGAHVQTQLAGFDHFR